MPIKECASKILETAVLQGDLLEVERLTFNKRLCYPILKKAVIAGQTEVAKILLNRGCELRANKIGEENEILHLAILSGYIKLVELLIKNGINIKKPDKDGIPPIFKVAHHLNDKYDLLTLLNCLLENGASLDTKLTKNGFTILHYAVELGNVNIINILIEKNFNLNTASDDGTTALHVAAKLGSSKVVELLLQKGANSNILTKKQISPLYSAVESGDLRTFETLLNFTRLKKRSLTIKNDRRRLLNRSENTILVYLAAHKNNISILKVLVKNGANVDFQSPDKGTSALHVAVKNSNLEMVELLVNYKAKLNTIDKYGFMPIHWACAEGNLPIVAYLLETEKCNLNAKSNSCLTPLGLAVKRGHSNVVSLLLGKKASYAEFKQNSIFLVFLALENIKNDMNTFNILIKNTTKTDKSYLEPVIYLIEMYSKVRIDKTGNSVLHIAVKNEDEQAVVLLLKHKVCIHALNKNNHTPLALATINGSYSIVNIFLRSVDDDLESFFLSGKNGFTPMHLAVEKGNIDLLNLFLKFGISVNLSKTNGLTPLHIAVKKNDKNLVSFLLKKGAKVNIQEKTELETLLLIAVEKGNADILEMLQASILRSSEWNGGYLLLCFAAYRGHERIVEMLLEKGVNPNVNLDKYLTPLHAAAQQGHENIVRLLLKHGAKVNPKRVTDGKEDKFFSTPLLAASYAKHWGIVQLLLHHGAEFNAKLKDASDISISKSDHPSSTSKDPALNFEQCVSMLELVAYFEKILIQGSYKDSEIRGEGTLIGYTCLHFALEAKNGETVKLLINSGAVVNYETKSGLTAIGLATEGEDEVTIKHLLLAGAETLRNHKGASILEIGSLKTNVNIAEIIVKSVCSSQRFSNDKNFTPLGFAIENKLDDCVLKLLKGGANVEVEHNEEPLLHIALRMKNTMIIKLLLEYRANVNVTNKFGRTVMLLACSYGHTDIAELLLDVGGIDDILKPLLEAIVGKHELIVESFLKRSLVKCNPKGICPFRVALQKSSPEVVQKFFDYKNVIGNFDVNENLYIYNAIQGNNSTVLEFLLKKGFALDASKNNGLLLHTALQVKFLFDNVFKLLIDYGVDVDAQDVYGNTPLGLILKKKTGTSIPEELILKKLLKLFLSNGADPNQLYGFEEKTMLELSIEKKDPDCVKMLLLYEADINLFNRSGQLPLPLALIKYLKCPTQDFDDLEVISSNINISPLLKVVFLLTQEVVRQKTVADIKPANEVYIETDYLKKYNEKCQQEIELMKIINVTERISYFDLFAASSRELASLARSNKVKSTLLPDSDINELFPVYAEMFTARIRIGRDRRHLIDSSYHLLNKASRFNLPPLVIDYVFSYLADRDLRNLNNAFKKDLYF